MFITNAAFKSNLKRLTQKSRMDRVREEEKKEEEMLVGHK